MAFCVNCGSQLQDQAKFCHGCGQPMQGLSAPPPVQAIRREVALVAINCPVCGAPIKPNDAGCQYCGSVIAIKLDMPAINPASLKLSVIDSHIAEHRESLRRDPNDAVAHYGLGIAYFNLGLWAESEQALKKAADLMPENYNIQYQLSFVMADVISRTKSISFLTSTVSIGLAIDRLDRVLRLQPEMTEAILLKASLLVGDRIQKSVLLGDPVAYCAMLKLNAPRAVQLWKIAAPKDPKAVRAQIGRFLDLTTLTGKEFQMKPYNITGTMEHMIDYPLDYVLPQDILRIVLRKQEMFGRFKQQVKKSGSEIERAREFVNSPSTDLKTLLLVSEYVACVLAERPHFSWHKATTCKVPKF